MTSKELIIDYPIRNEQVRVYMGAKYFSLEISTGAHIFQADCESVDEINQTLKTYFGGNNEVSS